MPTDPAGNQENIWFKILPIFLSVLSFIQSFIIAPWRARVKNNSEKLADSICKRLDHIEHLLANYWSKTLTKPDSKTRDADKMLSISITQCLNNINKELNALFKIKRSLEANCMGLMEDLHEAATEGEFEQVSRRADLARVKRCNRLICNLRAKLLPGEF